MQVYHGLTFVCLFAPLIEHGVGEGLLSDLAAPVNMCRHANGGISIVDHDPEFVC